MISTRLSFPGIRSGLRSSNQMPRERRYVRLGATIAIDSVRCRFSRTPSSPARLVRRVAPLQLLRRASPTGFESVLPP